MDIKQLHNEWLALQPIKEEYQKRLDKKFMLDFNFNSNHIEGNTLTYGQTELLFMFGETEGSANLRDYEEMKAHNVGLELVKNYAKDKERFLTENFVRELNKTILVEDFWKNTSNNPTPYQIKVGVYKTRPNSVKTATGEIFEYASPEETPSLMADLLEWYRSEEQKQAISPIELAALFHYRYIRIHPFEDGNGRIARLLVNYILARHNYPMIVIKSEDKDRYLHILHLCDVAVGDNPHNGANATLAQIKPFVEYLEKQVEDALNQAIKAAKGESIEEPDDFKKRMTIIEHQAKRTNNTEKRIFNIEELRNVLNNFYIPLKGLLLDVLEPSTVFFISSHHSECFSINGNSLNTHIDINNIDDRFADYKILEFQYFLNGVKREYNLKETYIETKFQIYFEDNYYSISCLNNKQFSYGTYPTKAEMNEIVEKYKAEVLQKIEEAMIS